MNDEISVVTRYKDTVFCILFHNKRRLLELYNALNNTCYKDPDALEIVTLENPPPYSNICSMWNRCGNSDRIIL